MFDNESRLLKEIKAELDQLVLDVIKVQAVQVEQTILLQNLIALVSHKPVAFRIDLTTN